MACGGGSNEPPHKKGLGDERHEKTNRIRTSTVNAYIQSTIRKSKGGTFLIHRTTITHIKTIAYYEAIMSGKIKEEDLEVVL